MVKLHLPLQSQLLRRRFSAVRSSLAGTRVENPTIFSQSLLNNSPKRTNLQVAQNSAVFKNKIRQAKLIRAVSLFFVIASMTLLLVLFAPVAYFHFFSNDPVPVTTTELGTPLGGEFAQGTETTGRQPVLPPQDETLPEGNWLIIPRIGVRTEILEALKPEDALSKGVWRVNDFGLPGDITKPMILAAHRYGYNWWWQGEYWRYHSFYLLPQLEPGDVIEVISDKRKYTYEIYAGEEGNEIKDYEADLILYTCKFLNSPIRHFRYARLLDTSKSTQQATTDSSKSLN